MNNVVFITKPLINVKDNIKISNFGPIDNVG